MNTAWIGIGLVVAAAAVESAAQICLKLAAGSDALRRRSRGWLAAGIAAYGLEIALYTVALRHVDVSLAYPLGSLSFVGVVLLARWLLRESVSPVRWMGVGCIVAGAMLVVR